MIAVRQERIQFTMAGLGVVGSAHDADDLGPYAAIALRRDHTISDRFHHAGRVETVRFGHEPGAEAQFDVA